MHKIKQIPEDFIVKEINKREITNSGQYAYYILKKKNCSTLKAAEIIANNLSIPLKWIGYAGNKDKIAVTEQLISIKNKKICDGGLKGLELTYIGNNNTPISLGDHEGNHFEIIIRNLTKEDIEQITKSVFQKNRFFPNYFGEQRFSKNNAVIGKSLVKKDFKKAIEMILKNNNNFDDKIKSYISEHKNDYVGALRIIPLKLRKLFVHAYQSWIFNKTIEKYSKTAKENVKVPIAGFCTEIQDEAVKGIMGAILKKEKITPRDFIIKEMPEITEEGGERDLFAVVGEYTLKAIEKDELNKGKQKAAISFNLKKGAYATVFIEYLLSAI